MNYLENWSLIQRLHDTKMSGCSDHVTNIYLLHTHNCLTFYAHKYSYIIMVINTIYRK